MFIGLVFLCAVTAISALPAASRSASEPDDCSKECLKGVMKYNQELSILKHPDLSNYFNKIDEVCEVITTAQKCLNNCGHTSKNSNPFALESLNIVCQPKIQEKISSIKQCLKYIDSNINEVCSKECNPEHTINENDATTAKMDPIVESANKNCANFKCMARCNVEVAAEQCGKEIGNEFEGLLQQIVDAQRKDLEFLNLVEAMTKTSPPECNYLYDPSVLFGEKTEESSPPSEDPKEDAKSLYAQAQIQLLLKQLELTEKQDQLIQRENAKLDMEMAFMAQKAERAEQKFHAQHSLPTFVPLEKMSKEPMEPLPSQPEASQPQESQPQQMPSEEPTHPEQMPPMEPHQPEMPMDFPHPMPLETIPEQPKTQKNSKIGPVIIDGMPYEFVPMGMAPMDMPMEAMPRF